MKRDICRAIEADRRHPDHPGTYIFRDTFVYDPGGGIIGVIRHERETGKELPEEHRFYTFCDATGPVTKRSSLDEVYGCINEYYTSRHSESRGKIIFLTDQTRRLLEPKELIIRRSDGIRLGIVREEFPLVGTGGEAMLVLYDMRGKPRARGNPEKLEKLAGEVAIHLEPLKSREQGGEVRPRSDRLKAIAEAREQRQSIDRER